MNDLPEFESIEKLCNRCGGSIGLDCKCVRPLFVNPADEDQAIEDAREAGLL